MQPRQQFVSPLASIGQPIAVCGPGGSRNCTSSQPGQALPAPLPWPSARARSPTAVVVRDQHRVVVVDAEHDRRARDDRRGRRRGRSDQSVTSGGERRARRPGRRRGTAGPARSGSAGRRPCVRRRRRRASRWPVEPRAGFSVIEQLRRRPAGRRAARCTARPWPRRRWCAAASASAPLVWPGACTPAP